MVNYKCAITINQSSVSENGNNFFYSICNSKYAEKKHQHKLMFTAVFKND